jgi:hypothetical protein
VECRQRTILIGARRERDHVRLAVLEGRLPSPRFARLSEHARRVEAGALGQVGEGAVAEPFAAGVEPLVQLAHERH